MSLYPLKSLIDKKTKNLQPNFIKALTRIFRLIDDDNDGWLTDRNIIQFQQTVFQIEMADQEVALIKEKIAEETSPNAVSYGLNLDAFQRIFRKMIDMIKIKNCYVFSKADPFPLRVRYRSQDQDR